MNRIRLYLVLVSTCFGLALSENPLAADIAAGRVTSTRCAVCHGSYGEGVGIPESCIACIDSDTFKKHLHDFKDGKRRNYMMQKFVADLSDEDIENLAAYYASKAELISNESKSSRQIK